VENIKLVIMVRRAPPATESSAKKYAVLACN